MTRKTKFENKPRKNYNQILNKCTDDAIYIYYNMSYRINVQKYIVQKQKATE